jgi:hypothetical protein
MRWSLGQQDPAATASFRDPLLVSDVLGIVSVVISNQMHDVARFPQLTALMRGSVSNVVPVYVSVGDVSVVRLPTDTRTETKRLSGGPPRSV